MNIRNNSSTNALGEYLRNNKELFRPLSKTEEQDLFRNLPPEEARKALVQHHIRLVFNLARKYASTSMDFDELIGRGFEGLCIAAEKFNPKRNIKFITYATPWVFKYIVKEYFDKDQNAAKMGVPLDQAISDTEDGAATFANIVNSLVDSSVVSADNLSVEKEVVQNDMDEICSDLTRYVTESKAFDDLDRTIFQRNLLEKDSIREISADLNLQYAVANRRKKDLIGRLKEYVEQKYGIRSALDVIAG